ncbi:MAG: hypothetical protein K0S38_291, partial [Candidatus Paceibacter sp.]|nr:hypothetical protein [Candidatus Paceibacter sp.]
VVDIEPGLHELAEKYFRLPKTPRLESHTIDARRFLVTTTTTYDFIFSDVYSSLFSIPAHLTTQEFFTTAKNALSENGVFAANIIGSLDTSDRSFLWSEIKTFKSVFPDSDIFAVDSASNIGSQNIIFVGYKNKRMHSLDDLSKKYPELAELDLQRHLVNTNDISLEKYSILTDDYAPVEYLVAEQFKDLTSPPPSMFEGSRAMEDVVAQTNLGPRYVGSLGHTKVQDFIVKRLSELKASTTIQSWSEPDALGKNLSYKNIIARINPTATNRIIIGSHYDSTRYPGKDSSKNTNAELLGANNSGSGTAVLLELVRILKEQNEPKTFGVDLIFFDGEEGEADLSKTPWRPIGSEYFINQSKELYPTTTPKTAIILDMVCDSDLHIYKEKTSTIGGQPYQDQFWKIAKTYFPKAFNASEKYSISDDHTPLIKAGIPSFLLIDFDYPYFDTLEDTPDKCSAFSLETVGTSLELYLRSLEYHL